MQVKVSVALAAVAALFFTAVMLAAVFVSGASPDLPEPYVKKGTWVETMLASRTGYQDYLNALARRDRELGLDGLEISDWHVCGMGLTTDSGQSLVSTDFPPEEAMAKGEKPNQEFSFGGHRYGWFVPHPNDRHRWADGVIVDFGVHTIGDMAAKLVYREITSPDDRTITLHLSSGGGLVLWLNEKRIFEHSLPPRECKPNEHTVKLDLKKGVNKVLLKLVRERDRASFYFSLRPDPGPLAPEMIQVRVLDRIREDFPRETDQFITSLRNYAGPNWLESGSSTEIEKMIISELLSARTPEQTRRQYSELVSSKATPNDPRWLNIYLAAVHAKRKEMNPPRIAFLRRNGQGRNGTNGTMLGRHTATGSEICVYDPAKPGEPAEVIFETREGFIFDMSPSYDATKLVFSYMESKAPDKCQFHIWEINVDGTGLRRITSGPYHDGSPAYLPDGRIVFSSTRVEAFSMCQDFLAAGLYVTDPAGEDIRRIDYNTLCSTTPFVQSDGSILFTRWEYQDKNIFCTQGLWTINPDGTRVQLFYGNTLTIPNAIYGAKQIPGSSKVVAVMATHHYPPLGAICIIDRSKGLENPEAMVNITPEVPYKPQVAPNWRQANHHSGDHLYYYSYTDPYPISEDAILVSYGGPVKHVEKQSRYSNAYRPYRIYLMDSRGTMVLLHSEKNTSCFNPVPLVPRPLPVVIPGSVPEPDGDGEFYVQDIYQGLLDKGVTRGQVTSLRVMSQVPKKYNTEGPRLLDAYPVIGHGTYYVKHNYGTVPVHEDGSAYFKAPAGVELYFIALDKDGKEVRRMGTVTQITKGERQGCVGCHESRFQSPPVNSYTRRLAAGADKITPEPWGAGTVSYPDLVQPVLDKHCVSCHGGRTPKANIDLSGAPTRFFSMSYEVLAPRYVDGYWLHDAPSGNFPPLATGSWTSRLTKLIEDKHHDVDMPTEDRRRIYAWIDSNIPYYGTWDMTRPHSVGGRDLWWNGDKPDSWVVEVNEVYQANCASCHSNRPIWEDHGKNGWFNLANPEYSRVLNAHLSKDAGGKGIDRERNNRRSPIFADTQDPVYQSLLAAIQAGQQAIKDRPREDMPGAVYVPQQRNFGRLY